MARAGSQASAEAAASTTYGTAMPLTCWRLNVHPKIASERLGHSRVGITLDLYSHVVGGLQETAVALVDDAMAKALQRRSETLG